MKVEIGALFFGGGLVISLDSKEPSPSLHPSPQRQPELCVVNEIQKKESEVGVAPEPWKAGREEKLGLFQRVNVPHYDRLGVRCNFKPIQDEWHNFPSLILDRIKNPLANTNFWQV